MAKKMEFPKRERIAKTLKYQIRWTGYDTVFIVRGKIHVSFFSSVANRKYWNKPNFNNILLLMAFKIPIGIEWQKNLYRKIWKEIIDC